MKLKSRDMTSLYVTDPENSRILMLKRIGSQLFDYPAWVGTAGGHFESQDEGNPYRCVIREANEETGLSEADFTDIKLKYITIRLTNGEIRHNYYFFTQFRQIPETLPESNEGELHWVRCDDVLSLRMPLTAKECLRHYLAKGERFTFGETGNNIYCAAMTLSDDGINGEAVFVELKEYK